jgi:hypothetical protein
MSTALKLPVQKSKAKKITVEYEVVSPGVYRLSSADPKVLKLTSLGFRFDQKTRCFTCESQKLPTNPSISLKPYKKPVPPEASAKARITRNYEKLLKMRQVIEKMLDECDGVESLLIADLLAHGLKLKPGCPKDAELLVGKTKLHHYLSVNRNVDQDELNRLAKKWPSLKKCFQKRVTYHLDKRALATILANLPESVEHSIIDYGAHYAFLESPVKNPGCEHCGGMLRRDKTCKRCEIQN